MQILIAQHCSTPQLSKLITELLRQPGHLFDPHSDARWAAYVMAPCRLLGGDLRAVDWVVCAVECVTTAADIVDDLVDTTGGHATLDMRRRFNAAFLLGQLAHTALDELPPLIGVERANRIRSLIARNTAMACVGEDLDLLFEYVPDVSEAESLEMTSNKAGGLVAMACQAGAAIATDDLAMLDLIGVFGRHMGTVTQLLNDMADIDPAAVRPDSDLQRRKKTLPITYALRCAAEEQIVDLLDWSARVERPDLCEANLAGTIQALGAVHYTWIVADAHRREALAVLRRLTQVSQQAALMSLRDLLPSLRARRTSIPAPLCLA